MVLPSLSPPLTLHFDFFLFHHILACSRVISLINKIKCFIINLELDGRINDMGTGITDTNTDTVRQQNWPP